MNIVGKVAGRIVGKSSGQRVPALPAPEAQAKNAFLAKTLLIGAGRTLHPLFLPAPEAQAKKCIS